jgi:hypothetical protein
MKTLLIIYPHWHPANLAGVHRPRLTGNFLKEFGWNPKVLTVQEEYFEEKPDPDFERTFSPHFDVTRVKALPVLKPRIVGDIGLRAFFYLYKGALKIIRSEHIDFIWIPIPSFYCALLGRLLYHKTTIPYGIDYIDPWVRDISNRKDWRHRLSNHLAKFLEPIAVKKAALITGVSHEYFLPVLERNFRKKGSRLGQSQDNDSLFTLHTSPFTLHHVAFPYGFDPNDHSIKIKNLDHPWSEVKGVRPWIYAGAFLPNSRQFVEALFESISLLRKEGKWDEKIRLYFIGTGTYPGKTIWAYANDAGIADIIIEDRSRFPFLKVLNFLSAADTVMVIGSTEKHYTASKVYQAILSERPVWAVFHQESSAVQVMEECSADQLLVRYREGMTDTDIQTEIRKSLLARIKNEPRKPDLKALEKYSARESARKLVQGMELVLREM